MRATAGICMTSKQKTGESVPSMGDGFPRLHRWMSPCLSSQSIYSSTSLKYHEQLGQNLTQLVRMSGWIHNWMSNDHSCFLLLWWSVSSPQSSCDDLLQMRTPGVMKMETVWFREWSCIMLRNEILFYLTYFMYHNIFLRVEAYVRISYLGLNDIPM